LISYRRHAELKAGGRHGLFKERGTAFALMMAVYMPGNADAAELKVLSSGALKLRSSS